jgi:3-oxoacyl-[acyl-carrier protein] reductase
MTDVYDDAQRDALLARIPLGRFGRPEELAAVVRFLVTDQSSYMTGAVLDANGGMFMP